LRPLRSILGFLVIAAIQACEGPPVPQEFAARLGSEILSQDELGEALEGLTVEMDSADAARQVVEQWVTNQLLLAEARRRGIDRDPRVRAHADDAERAVVVDALLGVLFEESPNGPTEAEMQDYFERNRDRLRLAEPYVRMRYLAVDDQAAAQDARTRLARLNIDDQAGWENLVDELSTEAALSRGLAMSLVPETRAFSEYPSLASAVIATRVGRTTPAVQDRGSFHIVTVLQRVPAGTLPERAWIEESLRQQLRIESRKLLYARLVQRLRNEALAREQLQVR
jgi:hypothetical protein